MSALTFGSLFAGIGGLDLGLERAGLVCKWQVEIDDYARRVLAKHWPNVRRHDDICTFPPDTDGKGESTLPKHEEERSGNPGAAGWHVDLIAGGFPCQDISYAGTGAGLAGKRSGLFYEAIRVIRTLGPRYIVLENVAALLTRGMGDVLGTLAAIGFDAEWHCIPAAAVGAPHIRDRAFILGYSRNSGIYQSWGGGGNRPQCSGLPGSTGNDGKPPLNSRCAFFTRRPERGAYCWDPEPAVGRVANGVPRWVDRIRGLGNSVVPQVAELIGSAVIRHGSNHQHSPDPR